ncbi:hypothetical protein [Cellulosimicrobium aquatile]|uniref:hypothetical protein n=1 Tax=Cellulosimicrobium aquatile TaxID=1612203 RepID=UPI0014599DD4|nr:hypothetical protein [Cellulosimicrobium aquatile]NMF27496.1 hypothetical protein [Cellulosimicrobium aquatile]
MFSDLLSAVISSSRNFHRLEHLGRRSGNRTFDEEAITGLVLAELTGRAYEVVASCTECGGAECSEWSGQPPPRAKAARARAMTKREEGGNAREGKVGNGADFAIAVQLGAGDRETRLLVQAKRSEGGERPDIPPHQYQMLLDAAASLDAAPFYAIYVQAKDAHTSLPTACDVHVAAAERCIVLVPAGPKGTAGYLPKMSLADLAERGRPLRCLAGCTSTSTRASSSVGDAVNAFVHASFSDYVPASADSPPLDVGTRVEIRTDHQMVDPMTGVARDQVLMVRLGERQWVSSPEPRFIGHAPEMTAAEIRQAARMWWRLNARRALTVGHVVAVERSGDVVGVYRVKGGIERRVDNAETRVAFDVEEEPDEQVRRGVVAMADRVTSTSRGTRNPVRYLGPLDLTVPD